MKNLFPQRLKELREEKKLTKSELAKQINVSCACISRWEQGLREPSLSSIIILIQFFDCTSDYLIGLDDYE